MTKFSSKYDRVSKNIERVNKRYTGLFAQLESQAKQMQSNAKIMFQNRFGMGMGSVDLYNYTGMNGFVAGMMQQALESGIPYQDKNGNESTTTIDSSKFKDMMAEYMQYGRFIPKELNDGKYSTTEYEKGWTQEEVNAFMKAMNGAKLQQQQAQMACNNMSQAYENNVSIWLEAAKAQLEAEQDAALEPLNYEQTMWELEKEQTEQRLARIKADLESYTQLCSEEAKEQAPKFGLG
ncbi:MAG: hypothetical protein MJ230_02525 [bacterium]|nr:hypothetical protein [bacterium]